MRRSGWSLATRLAFWYAITAFLLVTGAGLIQYRSLVTSLADEDDHELLERLHGVVRSQAAGRSLTPQDPQERMIVRLLDSSCVPITVYAAALPPPACIPSRAGRDTVRDWRSPGGRRWKIAVTRTAQTPAEWMEVLLDRSSDDRVLAAYVDELLLVLGASLGLAAALGYGLARQGLRPINVFARRVAGIDAFSHDAKCSCALADCRQRRISGAHDRRKPSLPRRPLLQRCRCRLRGGNLLAGGVHYRLRPGTQTAGEPHEHAPVMKEISNCRCDCAARLELPLPVTC